jgi:hypothetical protein
MSVVAVLLHDKRDGHRLGAHALARDAAGGLEALTKGTEPEEETR